MRSYITTATVVATDVPMSTRMSGVPRVSISYPCVTRGPGVQEKHGVTSLRCTRPSLPIRVSSGGMSQNLS